MSLNVTVTKKILENIIHETFSNFGFLTSSSLLDSLKLLGFYYATNAGISINIEDLRTPDLKKEYIEMANKNMKKISEFWSEGLVSDQERFQSIIDSWNLATESLKNRIVEYYQTFDPANNLYIMAFSGARGNMMQVRQLVGMRGLMSDQAGKIIDLPIQTNFREGLSSIDYIISSYGARKGIVDTALKTADSGYLTRRLIYLAQDLIIREIDCKTKIGIIILLKKESSVKNLIGREILAIREGNFPYSLISDFSNQNSEIKKKKKRKEKERNKIKKIFDSFEVEKKILTLPILENLKQISPLVLNIRSSLTCKSKGSICQKCYGWDLAHQKLIGLGENIGIIAAQSIGEPGTQLTMRTFHTGGIFTGETLKQTLSPFSGKIIIPNSLKAFLYRTNHGIEVLKLQQEANIQLINWKGIETTIFLEIGSYLYILKTSFVYQGQLVAENFTQSFISTQRKLKPIYTQISGKILFDHHIPVFCKTINGYTKRVILKQGLFWIISGKIFVLPFEAEYSFSKYLKNKKLIAKLKIITPKEGIILFDKENVVIQILRGKEKIILNLSDLDLMFQGCSIKVVSLDKNYQYVDKHTIVAFIYIFPVEKYFLKKLNNTLIFEKYKIFSIEQEEKKEGKLNYFFLTSEKELWNFYGRFENFKFRKFGISRTPKQTLKFSKALLISILNLEQSYSCFKQNQISFLNNNLNSVFLTPTKFKNSFLQLKYCGLVRKQDGDFNLFQHVNAICLPTNSLLNYSEFDYIFEKDIFATLVNYTQQTDDIVQGLPKIEELIEARQPKISAFLAPLPSIFIANYMSGKRISKGIGEIYIKKSENLAPSNNFQNTKQTNSRQNSYLKLSSHLPFSFESRDNLNEKQVKRTTRQIIILFHNLTIQRKNIITFNNKLFKIHYFSPLFKPVKDVKKNKDGQRFDSFSKQEKLDDKKLKYFIFKNKETKQILKIQGRTYWKKPDSSLFIDLILSLNNYFNKNKSNKENEIFLKNLQNILSCKSHPIKYKKEDKNDLKEKNIDSNSQFFYKLEAKGKEIEEEVYLYKYNKNLLICLEEIQTTIPYRLPFNSNLLFKPGEFIDIGEPINDGIIDSHELLNVLFSYHSQRDGIIKGTIKSLNKFQLVLVNSIQSIYQGQGVNISSKHIEIIVKQMTSKVIIKSGGSTPFLPGELIPLSLIINIFEIFKVNSSYRNPIFEPKLLSATTSSLNKDGFLSSAGFQETRRVLTKAAIEGNSDWLRGLKESIISGRIMPAGSGFLNYKTYLDSFYHLKK